MSDFPALSGKDVIRLLRQHGFEVFRVRGSHHFLKHSDGRITVVPVHGGENIGPGLLSKILRQTELSREDLLKFQ
jgi:predicted RNA binding protein YcfA (HicA-like mRNA interferase family)